MKKIVFCNILMKGKLDKLCYDVNDMVLSKTDREVIFPINALLAVNLKQSDDVKVVLLLKDDINQNSKRNMGEFMAELDDINMSIGANIRYEYITSPFVETKDTHENLIKQMIDKIEEGQELYADITYGPKPLPIVLFTVMNFAEKFMGTEIKNIVYGKVDFTAANEPINPILYDVSPLYFLNSVINTMEVDCIDKAKTMLDTILDF